MQTQITRTDGQLERKLSTEIQSLSTGNTNYNEHDQQAEHRPQRNLCCHANTPDSQCAHARMHARRAHLQGCTHSNPEVIQMRK